MTNDTRQHILDIGQVIIGGKGFSAVGLNEIFKASGVPKGSFYHYFSSKEAFGKALIESYFTNYFSTVDCDPKGKCLVVKLAAEVSDLSEAMRVVLEQGTSQAICRLKDIIQEGIYDKSLPTHLNPQVAATTLYQLWLGASICTKITRTATPLESALVATKELLGLSLQGSR